jgi:hypothetical protein
MALIEVQKYVAWPVKLGYLTRIYGVLTFLQLEFIP